MHWKQVLLPVDPFCLSSTSSTKTSKRYGKGQGEGGREEGEKEEGERGKGGF